MTCTPDVSMCEIDRNLFPVRYVDSLGHEIPIETRRCGQIEDIYHSSLEKDDEAMSLQFCCLYKVGFNYSWWLF